MAITLPQLQTTRDNITAISQFQGVNKGLRISDAEFEDMTNMTNDYFPVLANRKKRGVLSPLINPMGMCGGRYLAYVDDNKLYYDFSMIRELEELNTERQLVMMGAYLCVFPDGIVYNTSNGSFQDMENETSTTDVVTMRMCKLDGTEFTDANTHIGATAPSDTTVYPYWLDTSNNKSVILKMWSATYSMWTSVATTYVKIASTGIGKGFKAYDSVTFSGINTRGYNGYDFNDTLIVYAAGDDYLIVAGLMDLYYTQTATVTAKRTLPLMDFVCELDNRIWGCRYGLNNDGDFVNEIYASKQGDATNWNYYAGLANDSYAASVGSEGEFTGIAAYGGYVYFFKEDGFHKLYGSKPSNYEMIWKPCRGVQNGCSKSIAIVDEVLLFKSRDAIVAYDGSEETISDKLGVEPYYEATAVGYRNKYYISMRDASYNWYLYVYDITKGTWCSEDGKHLIYAAYADNGTYIVDSDNGVELINNEKISVKYFPAQSELGINYEYPFPEGGYSSETESYTALYPGNIISGIMEDDFEWSVQTGDLGLDNPYNKYLKRINIRMQMDVGTKLKIEVEYDSSGEWEYVTEYYASKKKSYEIPIAVRRADHVKLKLSGWGDFKLFTIAKAVESGSGENEGSNT